MIWDRKFPKLKSLLVPVPTQQSNCSGYALSILSLAEATRCTFVVQTASNLKCRANSLQLELACASRGNKLPTVDLIQSAEFRILIDRCLTLLNLSFLAPQGPQRGWKAKSRLVALDCDGSTGSFHYSGSEDGRQTLAQ